MLESGDREFIAKIGMALGERVDEIDAGVERANEMLSALNEKIDRILEILEDQR